ncbi:hypothetical protein QTG56_24965 (plasmid) [Rossellomorea sp. AcN35-11]|nr:hypothetical protein QTG56_24965 [Rossellomorea sp. AcN35-11]
MKNATHELVKDNPYIGINVKELYMTLDEVNRMPLDDAVKLSAVVCGAPGFHSI